MINTNIACVSLLGCVLVASCTGIETGNPPLRPELDGEKLSLIRTSETELTLTAAPGTIVDPLNVQLRVVPLRAQGAPVVVSAAADGSVSTIIPNTGDAWFRLNAIVRGAGGAPSMPVDLYAGEAMVPWPCLRIVGVEAVADVEAGAAHTFEVVVSNACSDRALTVSYVVCLSNTRYDVQGDGAPLEIAASSSVTLHVDFQADAVGYEEEIISFAATDGELKALSLLAHVK